MMALRQRALSRKLQTGWNELATHSQQHGDNVIELSIANSKSFTVLLESISEGAILVDETGDIIYANARAANLFGASRDKLVGQSVDRLVPDSLRSRHSGLRQGFAKHPTVRPMGQGIDLQAQRWDGTTFPAEVSLSFLEDGQGRVYVAFITDITARKNQESALIQAGKLAAIGELAGNIAHEVNNPIGIISAKTHLLLATEGHKLSAKARTDLEKIVEQCDRLGKLTRGLLNFSRPAMGERLPLSLHQPIRGALGLVYDRAKKYKIEILERLFSQQDMILGNPNELQQIFLNFFLNAIDAMPNGGRLTVGTDNPPATAGEIAVTIVDTGVGMTEDVARKIFEPFFTTKEKDGTGLGLAICLGLVRSHGGSISVDSKPGEGTTFTLRFPLSTSRK